MSEMATFDILVLGALAVGGLLGLVIGLVRGALLALSWAGAALASVYFFPTVSPPVRKALQPEILADFVAGGAVFLVALIALHLLSYAIADRVRGSRLRLLDRSLGLVAGLLLPAALLSAGYLYGRESIPAAWLEASRTQPLVEQGAKWVAELLPPEWLPAKGKGATEALRDLTDGLPAVGQLLRPPIAADAKPNAGYRPAERRALETETQRRP